MTEPLRIIIFLLLVNGLPPLFAVFAQSWLNYRLDAGKTWFDGWPLFGSNKTVRGLTVSICGGTLGFQVLGQSWLIACITATLAMTGDLVTSFIKRRIHIESGKDFPILDQTFESLFPLLFLNYFVELNIIQNIAILLVFITFAYSSSRIWQYITERPLPSPYPRIIKSSVRYREWRACHTPLAKWQVWFNLTSFLSDQVLLTLLFKLSGLYSKGEKNAIDIKTVEKTYYFNTLPNEFEGFRILFLTDLHLDGLSGITRKLTTLIAENTYDLCLIGGDIRLKIYGNIKPSIHNLEDMMQSVNAEYGTFGVLGNHDCIEMLPALEDAGVVMLVNDSVSITRGTAKLWVIGVDDPHYYKLDDTKKAAADVPENGFSIYLAHSPEAYMDAAEVDADLYLCGHTHGGQVCLTPGNPIITNSRAPRYTAVGKWRHGAMQGYTSRGAGTSAIPVRFNCPGEITLITLRKI